MNNIIIASGPVIVRDNKVLLDLSSGDSFWKFCGGRPRDEETLRQTAARRAKEELGIDIDIQNDEPYIMYTPKSDNKNVDVLLVHWLSDFSGEVVPGRDVEKWQWHDINNLPENIGPNIIPALKHFNIL